MRQAQSTATALGLRAARGSALRTALIAALLLMPAAALYANDFGHDDSGTWPQVSSTLTVWNGWIIAQGRTLGNNGQIIWQVALAPYSAVNGNGNGMTIRHGVSTTFVEVGPRQFVIDNATGNTRELRNGRIWRRFGPGGEVTTTDQQPPRPTPGSPGTSVMGGARTDRFAGTSELPDATPSPRKVSPAERRIELRQQALQALLAANDRLLDAMSGLDQVRLAQRNRQATVDDVATARLAVRKAEQEVRRAQGRVSQQMTLAAATSRPSVDRFVGSPAIQDPQTLRLQDRALSVQQDIARTSADLAFQKRAKVDADTIALTQARLGRLYSDLDKTAIALQTRRLASQVEQLTGMTPALRNRIAAAQQKVVALNQKLQSDRAEMQQTRKAYSRQQVSKDAFEQSMTRLAGTLAELQAAEQSLAKLQQQARTGKS